VQTQFADKLHICLKCAFFVNTVREETGGEQILKRLFAAVPASEPDQTTESPPNRQ